MKKKTIFAASAIWLVMWVLSIAWYEHKTLSELYILRHYERLPLFNEGYVWNLSFVKNTNDPREVRSIVVPGFPSAIRASGGDGNYHLDNYVSYRGVQFIIPNESDIPKKLTELEVTFSDGSSQMVDIGELYLDEEREGEPSTVLSGYHSRGSENEGSATSRFAKDALLTNVTFLPAAVSAKDLEVSINDSLWEKGKTLSFSKGEPLKVSYRVVSEDGVSFAGTIHLHFRTSDGTEFVEEVPFRARSDRDQLLQAIRKGR
ncbi:hypothetical protein M4D70_20705 [Brevibacillus borstelensis]|uniref:hypothetical protein n=1 Tax=Brevibacillus TaxID=55080 RepID=UPI00203F2F49|nr:hypothetical protein [Brevibacillus borstelensis]MCM3624649.1 hypothetical protein [Brevibacillus borstelensis]